jgi:adenine phosphoribosyltransferase
MSVQKLVIDTRDAALMRDKRILIRRRRHINRRIPPRHGGACQKAGGILAGKMAVLAEGDAQKRDVIITLGSLPISIRTASLSLSIKKDYPTAPVG